MTKAENRHSWENQFFIRAWWELSSFKLYLHESTWKIDSPQTAPVRGPFDLAHISTQLKKKWLLPTRIFYWSSIQNQEWERKNIPYVCIWRLSKICPINNFTYISSLICTDIIWIIQKPIVCIFDVSLLYTFYKFPSNYF